MDTKRSVPSQEYLLQGSILDDSLEILLHRLRGMCDNFEDGLVPFREHEITYSMREGPDMRHVNLRVREPLDNPDRPWTLTYLGNPEVGDRNRLTTVRTCVDVNCASNVNDFLQELGFAVEFEFVSQGWMFRKNRLKATVSKIYRLKMPQNLDNLIPISSSHLVEVSMISSSSNEQAANEVHSFSEQLMPLVSLDKIDPRRLNV